MSLADRCEELEQQLAAAIAACRQKDEMLSMVCDNYFMHDHHERMVEQALAIQPDDAALKAWLGEPVATAFRDYGGSGAVHLADLEDGAPLYTKPRSLK